jgi:hypothetical protein
MILIPGFITIQVLPSRFTFFEQILLTIPPSIFISALFATFAGMLAVKFNVYSYSVFLGCQKVWCWCMNVGFAMAIKI